MRLRFPSTLHLWQTNVKTFSLARPFGNLDMRNKLHASCRHDLAQRRAGAPQPRKRALSEPKLSTSRKPAAYEPLTDKLGLRASPTLLYRASSNANHLFGCYATGGGFLAAAWVNFQTPFPVQPGGVPPWVPWSINVGSFFIACAGFWMLLRPQNLVKAISCLPSSARSGPGSRSLLLQIERTQVLPFKQRRLITVPPSDVTISSHVFNEDIDQRSKATIAEIARREERLHVFARTNLFTLPFRRAGYWMWRGFVGIKSAFTSGGFHSLHVRGNNMVWKLDKDPAWALDDGKALDKLVRIKM